MKALVPLSLEQIDGLFGAETQERLPVRAPHPLQIKTDGTPSDPHANVTTFNTQGPH